MAGWALVAAIWVVGPLSLTWRHVAEQWLKLLVAVAVLAYTVVMWTVIAADDSSTAAIGYGTMAPLAYAPPLAGWAISRWRVRSTSLPE